MKKPKIGAWVKNGGNLYRWEEAPGDEGGPCLMMYGYWDDGAFKTAAEPYYSAHNASVMKWRNFTPCRKPKGVDV
jgi:hypothetical protein